MKHRATHHNRRNTFRAVGAQRAAEDWTVLDDPAANGSMLDSGGAVLVRRYFPAIAMGGRLYVHGIPEQGPWDVKRLVWYGEEQVDLIHQPLAGDRKAETATVLEEAIRASAGRLPAIRVWIHESLEDAAHQLWEESRQRAAR